MKIKSQNENKCVDNSQNEMYHIITKSQNEKKGKENEKIFKRCKNKTRIVSKRCG